ncbi:MAG TPA: glycosyltransferase family 39 protein [Solirubrobacteraceae bacterium]|jgi:4-amino-4-deoxy-L-arabinose transferase-like glycosyltransferase
MSRAPRDSRTAALRIDVAQWSGYAWGAIAATVLFIAMTCWWVSQDRSIPIYDAGDHLETAFLFRDMIRAGNLLGPFNYISVYPPLVHTIGALATFVGGVNVPTPIIAENLIFVPLLTLGCYRTGRLLFGSAAGLLAVLVVLASPLLMAQLHNFMLDPPMTALVAVSIWLILASEDFARVDVAAAAGFAAGVGMLTKVQFALYIAGLVLVVLLRGGWRNGRGLAAFLAVAAVVGAPWYIAHISEVGEMLEIANPNGSGPSVAPVPPGNAPPTLSGANLLWYFWNVLNSQLLAPLFLLAAGGTLWMIATVARNVRAQHARLELLGGCFLTWFIITLTPHHDIRYGMPLIAYVAVIATGWIVCLPRAPRIAAIAVLVVGVVGNTLGVTFGVGQETTIALAHPPPNTEQLPDRIIFYATNAFVNAAPSRDGDVPGLLDALHRNGVRTIVLNLEQSGRPDFSFEGLLPLIRIAGLASVTTREPEFARSAQAVTLIHEPVAAHDPPPCTRVSDGTGVWVVRYNTAARKLKLYCPTRRPQVYEVGKLR